MRSVSEYKDKMPPKNNSKEQLPDGNKKSPEKKKRSFEAIQDGKQIWQVGQEIFLPEGVDKENTTNDAFPISDILKVGKKLFIEVDINGRKRGFPAEMFGFSNEAYPRNMLPKKGDPYIGVVRNESVPVKTKTIKSSSTLDNEPRPKIEEAIPVRYTYVRIPKETWETLTPIEKAVAVDAEIMQLEKDLAEGVIAEKDREYFKKLLKEKKEELKQYRKGKKEEERGYVYSLNKDDEAVESLSDEALEHLGKKEWTNGAEDKLFNDIVENVFQEEKTPEQIELEEIEQRKIAITEKWSAQKKEFDIQIESYEAELVAIVKKEKAEEQQNIIRAGQERHEKEVARGIKKAEKSRALQFEKENKTLLKPRRLKKGVLADVALTAGTAGIIAAGGVMTHEGMKGKKPVAVKKIEVVAPKKVTTPKETAEPFENVIERQILKDAVEKIDLPFYKKLQNSSEEARRAYLYRTFDKGEQKEYGGSYVMIDKQNAKIYLISGEGKLLGESDILRGIVKGDGSNLVKEDFSNKIAEGRTPADWAVLSQKNMNPEYLKDGSWHIVMDGPEQDIYIHPLLSKDIQGQKKALESGSATDNAVSAGCIRVSPEFLKLLLENLKEGARCIILKEDLKNGKPAWTDAKTHQVHTIDEADSYMKYERKLNQYLTK